MKIPLVFKKLFRRRIVLAAAVCLLAVLITALLANVITGYDPNETAVSQRLSVPNASHLMGTDELGRDLKPDKDDGMSASSFSSGHASGALKTEVKLKNPSRNATVIKTLKGEVELFSPTEANGAILRIQEVLKHPAEPIQNPALAKYAVQLMYLTKETYEAKKKEIEAQQNAGAGQKLGDAFGEMFKGMFGNMMSNSKDSITVYIKDPDKRIVGLEFQDATGKPLKTQSSWSSSDFKQTQLAGPPPADTQLVVQLAVPDAVKTFPFEIHDIPLP